MRTSRHVLLQTFFSSLAQGSCATFVYLFMFKIIHVILTRDFFFHSFSNFLLVYFNHVIYFFVRAVLSSQVNALFDNKGKSIFLLVSEFAPLLFTCF